MTDTPKNREELDRMLEYQIDAAVKVKVHSDGDVTTKVNVPQFRAALESHGVRFVPVEATVAMKERMRGCGSLSSNQPAHRDLHWCGAMFEHAVLASPFRPDTGDEG